MRSEEEIREDLIKIMDNSIINYDFLFMQGWAKALKWVLEDD